MKVDIIEPLALGFGFDGWEIRWHRKPQCSVSKNLKSTSGLLTWLWKLNFDRFLTIGGCVEDTDSITSWTSKIHADVFLGEKLCHWPVSQQVGLKEIVEHGWALTVRWKTTRRKI